MRHVLSFLLAVMVSGPSLAGSTIDPVVVDLQAGRGAVSVTNVTSSSIGYEVRALDWASDETGQDVLSPTENLVVFPPLFRLAPGQTITLRLREAVPPSQAENAYRLEITEEPPQVEGTGVGIQMQYLTSAFSAGEEWSPSVACRLRNDRTLRVENGGRKRARIDAVVTRGADITAEVEMSGRLVLAEGARVITLAEDQPTSGIEVHLESGRPVPCE